MADSFLTFSELIDEFRLAPLAVIEAELREQRWRLALLEQVHACKRQQSIEEQQTPSLDDALTAQVQSLRQDALGVASEQPRVLGNDDLLRRGVSSRRQAVQDSTPDEQSAGTAPQPTGERMTGQQLVNLLATEGPLSWADLKRRAGLHPKVLSEMLATAGQAKQILKVDGLYQAVKK